MTGFVTVTVLPQNKKVEFERNKLQAFGQRMDLDGQEKSYILYDGQEIEVVETYEELKEIIK